ncbi:MAG: hypothetical protein J6S75_12185, partial [Thermoguttaceae bacterium]|nr:hypothetical protein [Thermoguttaceae bacterium]
MRSRGAKIGLIIDPRSQHETGDTRYPAIRYLDLCLSARLPEEPPADSAQRRAFIRDGLWFPSTDFIDLWR